MSQSYSRSDLNPRMPATKPPGPLTTRSVSSPAESVTQSLKNDLEDLIAHIDGFVFEESKMSSPRPSNQFLYHDEMTQTPATNRPVLDSHRKPSQSQAIFRDRTNDEKSASSPAMPVKPPRDPVEITRNASTPRKESPIREPSGSPPPGESSLYFHDESLSMILSKSSYDIEEVNLPSNENSDSNPKPKSTPSPKLQTRLREEGILPPITDATPAPHKNKAKSISFRRVARDATPAKGFSQSNNEEIFSPSAQSFPNLGLFAEDLTTDSPAVEQNKEKSWSLLRDVTPHPSRRRPDDEAIEEDRYSVVRDLNEVTNPTETDMTIDMITPKTKSFSPENAKKLLQTAVDTLKDARHERNSARVWAQEIKESVEQWVEEQRQIIRTESVSVAATSHAAVSTASSVQVQRLESSIHLLQNEISRSITFRSDNDRKLEELLLRQEVQIASLTSELNDVKSHLTQVLRTDGATSPSSMKHKAPPVTIANPPRYSSTPKSLGSSRWSEASVASSRTNRSRARTPSGGHVVSYGNGVTKEIHPDGTTVTRFVNGDVETRFGDIATPKRGSSKAIVAYFHAKEGVLQITQRDGSILYEYANGQMERHYNDGSKVIMFPDGTKTIVKGNKPSPR
ncbi:MAG: hypothetical protein SGILL_000810 [Bacillariaceae sp.]